MLVCNMSNIHMSHRFEDNWAGVLQIFPSGLVSHINLSYAFLLQKRLETLL